MDKLIQEVKEALDMQQEVRADIRELMNYLLSEKNDTDTYFRLKEIDKKLKRTL